MRIAEFRISNYRNLDGVKVVLNRDLNFLVGENEVGKSNFLDLLNLLFNYGGYRGFSPEDFLNTTKPIRVEFSLVLSDREMGAFEDIFDPEKGNLVNVIAEQEYSDLDERLLFYRHENYDKSPVEIPFRLFRRVNFIKYDSLRRPHEELTFYRGRGSSRFLGYLIQDFVDRKEDSSKAQYVVEDSVNSLIEHIEGIFNRLKPLRTRGIGLFTDAENPADLLARILKLEGANGFDIQRSGCGVQFSTVVILSILERLVNLKQSARWQSGIFTSERKSFTPREYEEIIARFPSVGEKLESFKKHDGDTICIAVDQMSAQQKAALDEEAFNAISRKKSISLVLGLDEPGIHLHPYRKRSLIKYIRSLLSNEDEDFSSLLREVFGVDRIDGQAIIVSNSPNVLLDDYRHVVRFYRDDGIKAVSGESLQMDSQMKKHLWMNFPYIKESFFSKCVIVVEGYTEFGALPLWAEKKIGDPDELGISIINVQSKNSLPVVVRLLEELEIPNVSVMDKDENNDESYSDIAGLRFTAHRDFEEDLFDTVYKNDSSAKVLFDVLKEFAPKGLDRYVTKKRLEETAEKYSIERLSDTIGAQECYTFAEVSGSSDEKLLKAMFLTWLGQVKSMAFGRFLGTVIDKDHIPQVYRRILEEARSQSGGVNEGSD